MTRRETGKLTRRHHQAAWRVPLRRRLVFVLLLLLPTITNSSASPQAPTQGAPQGVTVTSPTTGRQRIVIDGKDYPELVNRDLLVGQLLGLMAIPASANKQDERRLHSFASAIGFAKDDEQLLRTEMIRLHAVITPIQARLNASRTGVPTVDLTAYLEARLESYGRLLEILSEDGRNKLNDFIEKSKRNTKVIVGEQKR